MNKGISLLLGFILLAIGVLGLLYTPSIHHPMVGMMRAMTDIQFPPGLATSNLPASNSNEVSLLSKYCTQCHAMPGPGMHTEDEWPLVINRMVQYMQTMHTFHISKASNTEIDSILAYLQKHAQKSMDKSKYPDLTTRNGIVFMQTCSRCHSTPDPKQYTKTEWPAVVQRMINNMKIMGKAIPDKQQTDMVTAYLQSHAKGNE